MKIRARICLRLRKAFYKSLSGGYPQMEGYPRLHQPLLIYGMGKVLIGEKVQLGFEHSAGFWSSYTYFDLRGDSASIELGDNVILNNNTFLTADHATIRIGKNTVAGINLVVMTSDGHALNPDQRMGDSYSHASVTIEENVFIGDQVMILKGVRVGKNSVIGAGSVVTSDIPENVVAAGNPCRVLRSLI